MPADARLLQMNTVVAHAKLSIGELTPKLNKIGGGFKLGNVIVNFFNMFKMII